MPDLLQVITIFSATAHKTFSHSRLFKILGINKHISEKKSMKAFEKAISQHGVFSLKNCLNDKVGHERMGGNCTTSVLVCDDCPLDNKYFAIGFLFC